MPTTYTPIATQTLGSPNATVTFSSIPNTYTDLRLIIVGGFATTSAIRMRFNSDSASNYSYTRILGNGTAATSDRTNSDNAIDAGYITTDVFNNSIIDIMSYSNTSVFKQCLNRWNTTTFAVAAAALYRSTAAISTITLTSGATANWVAGSTFTLYGVKSA